MDTRLLDWISHGKFLDGPGVNWSSSVGQLMTPSTSYQHAPLCLLRCNCLGWPEMLSRDNQILLWKSNHWTGGCYHSIKAPASTSASPPSHALMPLGTVFPIFRASPLLPQTSLLYLYPSDPLSVFFCFQTRHRNPFVALLMLLVSPLSGDGIFSVFLDVNFPTIVAQNIPFLKPLLLSLLCPLSVPLLYFQLSWRAGSTNYAYVLCLSVLPLCEWLLVFFSKLKHHRWRPSENATVPQYENTYPSPVMQALCYIWHFALPWSFIISVCLAGWLSNYYFDTGSHCIAQGQLQTWYLPTSASQVLALCCGLSYLKFSDPMVLMLGRSSLSDCHPRKGSLNVRHLGALNNLSNYTAVSFICPGHENTSSVFLIFLDQHIFQKPLKAYIVPWLIKDSYWSTDRCSEWL